MSVAALILINKLTPFEFTLVIVLEVNTPLGEKSQYPPLNVLE